MRTPDRDRRGPSLAALCAALVILLAWCAGPAGALSAEYSIFPNGTAYRTTIGINDTSRYTFSNLGFMGEDVPVTVGDVRLLSDNGPVAFNWSRPWGASSFITFEKGNYTLSFVAPVKDNNIQAAYQKPYNITVTLPPEFRVENPLLAGLSTGANVTRNPDNSTTIQWMKTYGFECRFYSQSQQDLLFFFLQFMGILILVLVIIPYILSMRSND